MVIWHNTEDAQRTPAEVFSNDKVVLWIGSYPIEMGQSVSVQVKISDGGSEVASYSVEAEWRYNDHSRNNSYWAAIVGPFKAGQKVDYRITGTGPDHIEHNQVDSFTVLGRKKSSGK